MALNTVSSDRLSTNVKNTNFTAAEKQDLTDDILPLAGQLGNKNKIINGEFLVNQRGNSTNGSNSGYFGPDRFKWRDINSGTVFTISQSTDTPDGFAFSYHADCTTADASFSGNEFISIQHKFEGQNLQDFAKGTSSAEQYTLSFHVKSDVTGTYVVAFQDLDNNRMCCATYTVSSADTWEKKTITIPADTTGAFDNDNAASLMVSWCLGAGSDYTSGTLQTVWGADTSANTFVGQTANVGSSTDNDFRLTGVQLEVGSVATDFEHRSLAQELSLCQRYFFSETGDNADYPGCYTGGMARSGHFRWMCHFPVAMRTVPTYTGVSGNGQAYGDNDSTVFTNASAEINDANNTPNPRGAQMRKTSPGSMTNGDGYLYRYSGDGNEIRFDAEL